MYRYALGGERYTSATPRPTLEGAGLFDDEHVVTVYDRSRGGPGAGLPPPAA